MAYGIYGISACQRVGAASFFYRGNADDRQKKNESDVKSQEFRDLLRRLKQTSQQEERVYSGMPQNKVNGFLELSGSPESKKKEIQKKATYNYNEVANKIQRAKTAVSAGQAVISAKRKVSEIRRKIASHDGNEEELQLALTHARRMEMVARKKKHNLETEEMVENIQKRDERQDKLEEAASNAEREKVNAAEDQIADREDAVLEEREEMAHELAEQIGTRHIEISDDELAELNEMLAELGSNSKGVVAGDEILIIRTSKVPVALAEIGFITNNEERELMQSSDYQDKAARALYHAVLRTLEEQSSDNE